MAPRFDEPLSLPGEGLRRRREALTARLLQAASAAAELRAVALGVSLGLYDALREAGALSAPELARATGLAATDVAEWLAQQAESGVLDVDDASLQAMRRYALPHGHDEVLAEHDNPACLAPMLERAADTRPLREAVRLARSLRASAA